jgi:hypothetical protein
VVKPGRIRPFSLTLLAGVLTMYAMAGVYLIENMLITRDPQIRWQLLAVEGGLFALSAGGAALAVWRAERRAPVLLVLCGLIGGGSLMSFPFIAPDETVSAATTRTATLAAVLFAAFLFLAAAFVRRYVRLR